MVRAAQAEGLITVLVARRRWLLVAAVGALTGVAAGWLLAAPDPSSWVRALSLCAGSTVLGAAAVAAMMRGDRRPDVSPTDLWRLVAALGGLWLSADTVQIVLEASASVGEPVGALGARRLVDYLGGVGTGRITAVAWLCVAACTTFAAVAHRSGTDRSAAPVLVTAGLALIARPVTGHMSQQPLGSLLDAAHVVAAALWFGTLAALAALLRSRGAWARQLPRYSTLALRCVAVVAVTGVVDAAVRLGSMSDLVTTGYGRLVLTKAVLLAALLGLALWWRRGWVPAAGAHRVRAEVSLRNAVIEVCAMSVVFGVAAALATSA